MRVAVEAVLYAEATDSNLKSLRHESDGQYDFRYGTKSEFGTFFQSLPTSTPTALGGFDQVVPLASFDGPNPIPPKSMTLRNMGPKARRGPDVYFRAVQPGSGYPLWTAPRAFSMADTRPTLMKDVALVIRDTSGTFHARWIRHTDRSSLPVSLQSAIDQNKKGVWMPPASTTSDPLVLRVLEAIREHTNVLLYGPPATGKTKLVTDVRAAFAAEGVILDTAEERTPLSDVPVDAAQSAWVTFHQSYSYEDFIVGLRPEPVIAGGFSLAAHPGILLEMSEWVRQNPGTNEALLVIDEINRGNVSRIFGEFITLMEPNKRTDATGAATPSTVAVRLPHATAAKPIRVISPNGKTVDVPQPFTMPQQLFTLATMNSVDKSVAPLDAALRRRFHVIPLRPDFSLLSSAEAPIALQTGVDALQTINRRISGFLGPDFEFGHWFLAPITTVESEKEGEFALVALWRSQIFPQLEEHFIGRPEQLLTLLGPLAAATDPFEVVKPEPEAEAQGATYYVREKPGANDTMVLSLWRRLASASASASATT